MANTRLLRGNDKTPSGGPTLWLALLLALSLTGCKKDHPATPGSDRATRAGADAAPRRTDPCTDLRREFKTLRDAGGACKVDEDCACYLPAFDCGGVSDTRTGRRLSTLVRMYRLAGCPPPKGCDERPLCQPVCVGGRCVQHAAARVF